jgi:hypothetical protein
MINRRQLLAGGLCLCHGIPARAEPTTRPSCIYYNDNPGTDNGGLDGLAPLTLADDYNSNGFVMLLGEMKATLGVSPVVVLYDDPLKNPNALSCDRTLIADAPPAADGTVAVGRKLLNLMRSKPATFGSAMTATCAHEFGHILQFKTVLYDLQRLQDSAIRIELHADFVCGYYGAHRKRIDPKYDALTQAVTQFEAGDRDLSGTPSYKAVNHGTFQQRGDAVYAGFLLGLDGPKNITPEDVAKKGLDYVHGVTL